MAALNALLLRDCHRLIAYDGEVVITDFRRLAHATNLQVVALTAVDYGASRRILRGGDYPTCALSVKKRPGTGSATFAAILFALSLLVERPVDSLVNPISTTPRRHMSIH